MLLLTCSSRSPKGDTGGSQVDSVGGGDADRTLGSAHFAAGGPDLHAIVIVNAMHSNSLFRLCTFKCNLVVIAMRSPCGLPQPRPRRWRLHWRCC